MEFFASAVDTLKVLVMAIGCGLGAWGIVNLLEGYGADNPASMLMYGKEASNRKQEINRQHHTIPNKRTKDQKTSIMEMCITGYSVMDNSIHSTWKSEEAAFPRPANRVTHNSIRQPVIHITHNADCYGIHLMFHIFMCYQLSLTTNHALPHMREKAMNSLANSMLCTKSMIFCPLYRFF
ncbi:Maff2 family mobile element protein [Anaerotruncus colihominis]|uniref:Maff2 family mobile element protein n=1 Tax=Anaerotruncus colihominis TaxID=169435 RepID=UPI003F8B0D1E